MLPILALKFGFSYSECGLLYMIFQVSGCLLQAPLGIAADKRNLGLLLPISILTSGVLASSVGLCNSVWILVVIVFLSGICSSGFHPVLGGMVPVVSPKGREIFGTSIFLVGGNVGFAIAPFLTALYLEHFESPKLIYLAVFPIITTAIIFQRKIYQKEIIKNDVQDLSLKTIVACRPFVWLVLSIFFRAISYCALVSYIPLLITSRGYSSIDGSAVLMTMLLGTAIGGLMVGKFAKRYSFKNIIFSTYILTFVGLAIFLYNADNSIIAYLSVFLGGVGLYASTPVAIVWAQNMLPHADAFATSMMVGFTFGLGYLTSVLVGMLGDMVGLQLSLAVILLPTLVLAILALFKVKA